VKAADEKRLAAAEVDVAALARRLLPESAPDPSDPDVMVSYLTCEELARLEAAYRSAAEGELDGAQASAAWADAQRRAVARMLTGVDVQALEHRELCERVLVEVDRPPAPGRTAMVAFIPDQEHPGVWHVEACYRGVLPRTMTTAELAAHDPKPWPARTL
jgi:hypothetical protein